MHCHPSMMTQLAWFQRMSCSFALLGTRACVTDKEGWITMEKDGAFECFERK